MNPIGLDKKLDSDFERKQLKMIWDVCVPRSFTKYIFEKDNFVELSKQGLTYQKANNIVLNFMEKYKQNIHLLKIVSKNNLQAIQFCYSALYPKIYARTNSFGIENKANFDFIYNEWKKNKNALPFTQTSVVVKQEKNATNYKNHVPHPSGEKFVPENKKNITKKTIKTDAKLLNDARVAKTNEKKNYKDNYSKTLKK